MTVHESTRIQQVYETVRTSTYSHILKIRHVVFWPTQKETRELISSWYSNNAWDTMWWSQISKMHKFRLFQVHTSTYWYIHVLTICTCIPVGSCHERAFFKLEAWRGSIWHALQNLYFWLPLKRGSSMISSTISLWWS